jgi:tetratricopeptide (TPR) repeat protein
LLLRGDIGRAVAQAKLAHQKGPRAAEPLRLWGDALLAQGKTEEAERKYAQAAQRSPRWGRLYMQWANALWRLGRASEARQKLAAAAAMDLSSADRAQLRSMWEKSRRAG